MMTFEQAVTSKTNLDQHSSSGTQRKSKLFLKAGAGELFKNKTHSPLPQPLSLIFHPFKYPASTVTQRHSVILYQQNIYHIHKFENYHRNQLLIFPLIPQ